MALARRLQTTTAAMGVLLSVGVVACSGPAATSLPASALATASPSTGTLVSTPSGTADPTMAPSAGSSAGPSRQHSVPPGSIGVDSIATVVTDDLRVRSAPGTGTASKKLAPLLDHGRNAFVVAGPVRASGLDWYQIQPLQFAGRFDPLPFGWVASGMDGETWLQDGRFTCPSQATDFQMFRATDPYIALACHGRRDITFAARLGRPEATCGADPGWTVEPEWLGSTCPHPAFLIADPKGGDSPFDVVFDPGLDLRAFDPGTEPKDWLDVSVTGHYDDPVAQTCHSVGTESGVVPDIDDVQAVLRCRTAFVVDAIADAAP